MRALTVITTATVWIAIAAAFAILAAGVVLHSRPDACMEQYQAGR